MEALSEYIALVLYALCFALALARAYKTRTRSWVILASAYGCNLLAQAYWVGYMMVFGETPIYFYIAEIGWSAMYLFLVILLAECNIKRAPAPPDLLAWVPVIASAILCAYYIYLGSNVVACLVQNSLIAGVGFFAVRGIRYAPPRELDSRKLSDNRLFSGMCLLFVIAELGVWTTSCFLDDMLVPYLVCNYALFITQAGMLASAWRSEDI